VRLAYEPAGARADKYGRLLAYLYLEPGGLFVNREIVARGFGHAYTEYPFQFMDEFRAVGRLAREKKLGLWGPDPVEVKPGAVTTIWITRTGKKYHRESCRALAKGATALPLGRAAAKYSPCDLCHPPAFKGRRRTITSFLPNRMSGRRRTALDLQSLRRHLYIRA
jgi:hypothetical protein